MLNVYHLRRIRSVVESFRVIASSETEAEQTLNDEMDLPQVTENCDLTAVETLSSTISFDEVETVE